MTERDFNYKTLDSIHKKILNKSSNINIFILHNKLLLIERYTISNIKIFLFLLSKTHNIEFSYNKIHNQILDSLFRFLFLIVKRFLKERRLKESVKSKQNNNNKYIEEKNRINNYIFVFQIIYIY